MPDGSALRRALESKLMLDRRGFDTSEVVRAKARGRPARPVTVHPRPRGRRGPAGRAERGIGVALALGALSSARFLRTGVPPSIDVSFVVELQATRILYIF